MDPKEEWVFFLEKNPYFNEVAKSKIYILVLRAISKDAITMDKLHIEFSDVESKDLEQMVYSLIDLGLVSKINLRKLVLYTLAASGTKFIKLYDAAKKSFKIE